MATANQMMPLSGQPKRFSFHIEINDRTTRITPPLSSTASMSLSSPSRILFFVHSLNDFFVCRVP
jgi:hypothetical protein